MSRPGTVEVARHQAIQILVRALPGKRTNVGRRIRFATLISDRIWRRWQVGPWQWRLKHVEWYLDVAIADLSPSAIYDHWRTIRVLLSATGRNDLVDWLENRKNNSYLNPKGVIRERGIGGRRAYLPIRSRRSTKEVEADA